MSLPIEVDQQQPEITKAQIPLETTDFFNHHSRAQRSTAGNCRIERGGRVHRTGSQPHR